MACQHACFGTNEHVVFYGIAFAENSSGPIPLQPRIDRAVNGEVITLAPGTYSGPIVIDKSVTIQGDDSVVLINPKAAPAISVQSDEVRLTGFRVRQEHLGEHAAIHVTANQVVLSDLDIESQGYGIILRKASQGTLQHNLIRWTGPSSTKNALKGNGIDLYASQEIRITDNEIHDVRDGIYMENSRSIEVANNRLFGNRYAIHLMYVHLSNVTGNLGERNVTGAMVMGANKAVVTGNTFRKQSENVHSQGILLYDVQRSIVADNVLEGNRVGLYIQESSENEISRNDLLRNFVGVQFNHAEGNELHSNRFVSNVIEAQAVESRNNVIRHNYWDSFQGLDLNGDGVSEAAYAINPFYQRLIQRNSAFQLFFQSPGMMFLSDLHTEGRSEWLTDLSPRMKLDAASRAYAGDNENNRFVPWLGGLLLLAAGYMFYLGGRRK